MHLHLVRAPAQAAPVQRPAKVVALEVRRLEVRRQARLLAHVPPKPLPPRAA
jgi:hypothetical protein